MHDPIGDMLGRIRNAQAVHKKTVSVPFSRLKKEIAAVLKREGFVNDFSVQGRGARRSIEIVLRYDNEMPGIMGFRRRSRLSRREYSGYADLYPVRDGFGVSVISTPRGVMSDREARTKKVGGEVFFEIW